MSAKSRFFALQHNTATLAAHETCHESGYIKAEAAG